LARLTCVRVCVLHHAWEKADDADDAAKPCYDQQALMRRYDLISEVCGARRRGLWAGLALLAWARREAQHTRACEFQASADGA
jgi:hypothetical protein